jgi:formamidopyrimidine-DNA glycosylase
MPELPEVETTCQGIAPHLAGKKITSIDIRNGSLRWPVSDEIHHLKNIPLTEDNCVSRRAKYILIAIPLNQHIIIHLGMSGSLRICSPDEELKKHDHVIFHLSSGLQMRYHDPRRFGSVLWTDKHIPQHPLFIKLGPEPLTNAFSAAYLMEKSKQRKKTIKQHIMDNHIVVGVGNIYACEALFMAGINPQREAGSISKPRLSKLRENIREVLQRSIDQGGTTLKDFIQSDGQPGYFKQQLNVYDREGQPCQKCEALIKRVILGQRSTFYCPKCQK